MAKIRRLILARYFSLRPEDDRVLRVKRLVNELEFPDFVMRTLVMCLQLSATEDRMYLIKEVNAST